ncbi:MAG TPA: two-component regulator propeller domain-containing protein [Gammaproteobacteria bacterium]
MLFRTLTTAFLAAAMLLLSPPAMANTESGLVARLAYLDVEAGLDGDLVLAMVQDENGFVWIGTNNGLDRYDGSRIESFQGDANSPGMLRSQTIAALLIDSTGRLWIGTWGGGVYRHESETGTFSSFRHDSANTRSIQSDFVDSLSELADGRIVIGTQAGIDLLDPATGRIERLLLAPEHADVQGDLRVRHLLVDARGTLWIATRRGLFYKNSGDSRIHAYRSPDAASNTVLGENIYTLVEDDAHALLLGTSDGVWKLSADGMLSVYTPAGVDPGKLRGSRISAMTRTRAGDLLIGTLEHGALFEQRGRGVTRLFSQAPSAPYGVRDNQIASLLETTDGSLWFGTLSRGISHTSSLSLALEHYIAVPGFPDALQDSRLTHLLVRGDAVWLGTESGLVQFDPNARRFTAISESNGWALPADLEAVHVLAHARDGLWIIGDTGRSVIYRADIERKIIHRVPITGADGKPVDSFLNDVLEDANGDLWLSWYESKIGRLDAETGQFRLFEIVDPDNGEPLLWPRLARHPHHGIAVVTYEGALVLDEDGTLRWLFKSGIDDPLNSVLFDGEGGYRVGADSGAYRYSANGELKETLTREDGLPETTVLDISVDPEGRTWFLTHRGLAVRDAQRDAMHVLRARDGLQSDIYTGLGFLPDGRVVSGGPNGLNVFDYPAIVAASGPAALQATSIDVFTGEGERTALPLSTKTIVLQPEQDHLRVQFSLMDFSDPKRNRYEYRVLGSNDNWTSIDNTARMMLQQIEPGEFTLEIRAYGPRGIPSSNTLSLGIDSRPHWYESIGAKIGYGVIALLPFLLLAWLGLRNARTKSTLEAEVNRRRLLEDIYEFARSVIRAESCEHVATTCLQRFGELVAFDQGAMYFRNGERLVFAGTLGVTDKQRTWLEMLPPSKPRLMAKIAFAEEAIAFRNIEIDPEGAPMGIAANWIGVSATGRDGTVALLLLGRLAAWSDEECGLVNGVFRQAMHGYQASTLKHSQLDTLYNDEATGLPSRNAFLVAAAHRRRTSPAAMFLLTIHIRLPWIGTARSENAAERLTFARIGQRILMQLHGDDIAGRLDEGRFAVLLPGPSRADAEHLASYLAGSLVGIEWLSSGEMLDATVEVRELHDEAGLYAGLAATEGAVDAR